MLDVSAMRSAGKLPPLGSDSAPASAVRKRIVFDTTPKPSENLGKYAQGSVTKPITKSRLQYLTGSMSFDTIMVTMTIPSQRVPTKAEQKKRLLKAKIAVALHDELGRVPKQEEIEQLPIF